jgi:hypothetical protein
MDDGEQSQRCNDDGVMDNYQKGVIIQQRYLLIISVNIPSTVVVR